MPHFRVFLILSLIITIHSVVIDINYEILTNEAHPNKCVLNTTKGQTIMGSLESIQHPTMCGRVECGRDGWALIYTCVNSDPPAECIDVTFPDCCEMTEDCNYI